LASSLIANEFNVLVEGAADKPILEGAFRRLRETDCSRILVNGSVAENVGLLPRFYQRGRLPFVVYLDADSGARTLKTALLGWGVPEAQIVDLRPLFADFADRDFELEDITTIDFYHAAVLAAYPDQPVDPQPAENRQTDQVLRSSFSRPVLDRI